ncbi:MAG: hypothetical protein HY899_05415 [Deltaproteobacteria bacterium]|nr:hypothetical protein [Deltaproteobacteria bacterium]
MSSRKIVTIIAVVVAAGLLSLTRPARAEMSADQVLADLGVSAADKQRVLSGEFVTGEVTPVSDRDLSISIIFLIKASPAELAEQVVGGDFVRDDPQVMASGEFKGAGSLADLAGLTIDAAMAKTLASAKAGTALNLSTNEIAAFKALQDTAPAAVGKQLQQTLLGRFQAYQASGLAGIAPYDRGGANSDVAADLRKASDATAGLKKYLPTFQKALLDYPRGTAPGMQQLSRWLKYDIDGTITFVLAHMLVASDGEARAVVQRQYYASTGYNAEQAVAGFLPAEQGTVVVYANHTFTDQVSGFGGSAKRGIGRKMMASKLREMFDRVRNEAAR